jgi:hypothetical protein
MISFKPETNGHAIFLFSPEDFIVENDRILFGQRVVFRDTECKSLQGKVNELCNIMNQFKIQQYFYEKGLAREEEVKTEPEPITIHLTLEGEKVWSGLRKKRIQV